MTLPDREIRSTPRPACALCGGDGRVIHHGLTDRLFSAEGSWTLKHCRAADCGLVWLDPMPLTEDLSKAYSSYYTHAAADAGRRSGWLKNKYLLMRRSYLARNFGYHCNDLENFPAKFWGRLICLFPLRRRATDASVRFLRAVPGGRVLDVGCGSGEWLGMMRDLGWQVEGIDFDEKAVNVARQTGLNVRCGALEGQNFPAASFDAVTLNHVIEHVPDPVGTLKECARILKPGGKLVLATPNTASLSHRVFKSDWRGLEPPRHLHIFSPTAIRGALAHAGFRNVTIHPIIASSVVYESRMLRRGKTGPGVTASSHRPTALLARLFNLAELCFVKFQPAIADCLAAVATKD